MLTGVVGHIRWRYYPAAAINGYTVTWSTDRTQWTLVATVVLADAFKLAQRPLTFIAPHEKGQWTWPILDFTLEYGSLTAQLGPPETT